MKTDGMVIFKFVFLVISSSFSMRSFFNMFVLNLLPSLGKHAHGSTMHLQLNCATGPNGTNGDNLIGRQENGKEFIERTVQGILVYPLS